MSLNIPDLFGTCNKLSQANSLIKGKAHKNIPLVNICAQHMRYVYM